jgi:hypothetical protein
LFDLDPDRHAHPIAHLLTRFSPSEIADRGFQDRYQAVLAAWIDRHRPKIAPPLDNRPFLHQLDIPVHLARLLIFGLGVHRLTPGRAQALADDLDRALDAI